MRGLLLYTCLLAGCSNYANITPKEATSPWAESELSCDDPPACALDPAYCLCTDRPGWQLQDVNQNSERFMETYGLDAFDGRVTVVSLFKVDCDFCGQQMGYLQVLQDELAAAGYDVAMTTLLKKTGEVGTTCQAASDCEADQTCDSGFCHSEDQKVMSETRNSYGACALFDSPNCDGNEMTSNVTIKYPVFQDTEATNAWHNFMGGGSKDEIFVYRRDGKLASYTPAAERIVLADLRQYRQFRDRLKALALGKVACDADNPCSEGQWCRQPNLGTCGNSGFCVPAVSIDDDGRPVCPMQLYPQPICGCDGATYASACEAAASGVSIFDYGQCLD